MTEPPSLPPPPPTLARPSPDFIVIHVDALSAALEKLQVGITAAQLLDGGKWEERHGTVFRLPRAFPRTPVDIQFNSNHLALTTKLPDLKSGWPPYQSTLSWVTRSDEDKARRLKLRELVYHQFPGGKVPNPYILSQ